LNVELTNRIYLRHREITTDDETIWLFCINGTLYSLTTHNQVGAATSDDSEHFKDQRERLAATKVDVYIAPVYPVNQWLATDLVRDEIECRTYEQDLAKASGDNHR